MKENIYLIDTLALGYKNAVACYLVKSEKIAIIDTGYASTYMNVINAIKNLGIDLDRINYIIPTHLHLDHSGATGYLIKYMKNAKIIAHEKALKHLVDPSKLIESSKSVFGEEYLNLIGLPLPIEEKNIEIVKDELDINLGDLTLTCIYAPGHAPHQICVFIRENKALITADAVGTIYPSLNFMIPTTPPPSFEPNLTFRTIEKLRSFEPKVLFLPHFGKREDVNNVFDLTIQKIQEWINLISKLRNENKSFHEIYKILLEKVLQENNIKELPLYASNLIKISILGILNYLKN